MGGGGGTCQHASRAQDQTVLGMQSMLLQHRASDRTVWLGFLSSSFSDLNMAATLNDQRQHLAQAELKRTFSDVHTLMKIF